MPIKYELIAESAGLDTKYSVYKNGHRILYLGTKKAAEEYIKFNKEADKEWKILNKEFPINSICREDLIENIGKEKALKLTNQEIKDITYLMGKYLQDDYWFSLSEALDKLEIKKL